MSNPTPIVRNGVPVHKLFGAINKLKDDSSLGAFRFTAKNEWINGTASRSTIHEWAGMGGEHQHVAEFSFEADHPTLGHGHGPTPQEFVLHALAACITAGIVTTAAARKIELTSVSAEVQGDLDARGVLGVDESVRNGFQRVRVRFDVKGDAEPEVLAALVESSRARSAVFDIISNPTEVEIDVAAARERTAA